MTTIDPSLYLSNNTTEARKGGDALGKDAFLKLLVTQLQNQDPSSPMDNSEFIAQMATFSTLEQMVNIGNKLDTMIDNNKQTSLVQYSSFVGKEVDWQSIDESGEEAVMTQGTGVIESIQFKDNQVSFILEDGTKLEPANISQVNQTASANGLVAGSELIGKVATWKNATDQDVSAVIKSVLMSNGKLQYEMADGTKVSANQFLKLASA